MIDETLDMRSKWLKEREKNRLIDEAETAIAWGNSDHETSGYTPGQFISVIKQLLDYIKLYDK